MYYCLATAFLLGFLALPAEAQEREWSLDKSEDEAFMIFGVPESDDVGVSFWCKLKGGEVRLFVPDGPQDLQANARTMFDVTVSGKSFRVSGTTMLNEESGTMSVEGMLKVSDPLFEALKATDRFSIKIGSEAQTFPLIGADISELLSACSKA